MKKRILALLLVLLLAVSLIPAVVAGENPETGGYMKPYEGWGEYPHSHRYIALGQVHTVKLSCYLGKSNGGPRWKVYKTDLDGSESAGELAELGEKLLKNGKKCVDEGGAGIYSSGDVRLNPKIEINADELGAGTYLVVGYNVYQKKNSYETKPDYDTLCAIAVHVQEKETPIESIRYYECKEDGTIIRELTSADELKVYICLSSNDNEPSYVKVVPTPANATEHVQFMHSIDEVKPGEHYLTYDGLWEENVFRASGETCGSGKMNVTIRDYADDYETRELKDLFSVTVPHQQDGEVRRLIKPTCTEEGLRGAWCEGRSEGCDYVFEKKVLAPYGHGLQERGKEIVTEPTATKPGLAVGICSTCGMSDVEQTIPAIFSDVKPDEFYSDALDHGYAAEWVSGTSATTFDPNGQCMRAHVVTFLWRAAGCPEPVSTVNPFVDVKESDFYYKAVLWAVENGITNGVSATEFGPFTYCNRAQVVTFLHRAMGSPAPAAADCPFTDVEAGAWYAAPILWAVENGITNGMSADTFGVSTICNRAQVVTFLYRTYVTE